MVIIIPHIEERVISNYYFVIIEDLVVSTLCLVFVTEHIDKKSPRYW